MIDRHRLDALVAPTGAPAWVTDLVNGDHFVGGSSTPAAVAGYPTITVPVGFVFGLPVGISFIGRAWSEPRLCAWPTPSSRRRGTAARRGSWRRPTLAAGLRGHASFRTAPRPARVWITRQATSCL